jgi:RHS repeat-associated protein
MGTNLAFTGQYHETLTGFDYYGARYYDPVAGVFLSADIVQGNLVGADPYTYVGGNPETFTDPTGEMYVPPGSEGGGGSSPPPSHPNSNNNSGSGGILEDIGSIFAGGVQTVEHDTEEIFKVVADPETDPALPIIEKVAATAEAAEPEIEVVSVEGMEIAGSTICILCAGALMIISFLSNPTPLASGTLSTPISTAGNGTLGGLIPGTGGQSINIVSQDNSGSGPQPQAGGGGQGNKPPTTKPTAPSPDGPGPGRMNPQKVRFTQDTCTNQGNGYTVQGNIQGLQDGTISPEQMGDPIRVFQKQSEMNGLEAKNSRFGPTSFKNLADGEWYTLDNRRLYAFQAAGITDIPVEDVSGEMKTIANESWKFTTTNYGVDSDLLC